MNLLPVAVSVRIAVNVIDVVVWMKGMAWPRKGRATPFFADDAPALKQHDANVQPVLARLPNTGLQSVEKDRIVFGEIVFLPDRHVWQGAVETIFPNPATHKIVFPTSQLPEPTVVVERLLPVRLELGPSMRSGQTDSLPSRVVFDHDIAGIVWMDHKQNRRVSCSRLREVELADNEEQHGNATWKGVPSPA